LPLQANRRARFLLPINGRGGGGAAKKVLLQQKNVLELAVAKRLPPVRAFHRDFQDGNSPVAVTREARHGTSE